MSATALKLFDRQPYNGLQKGIVIGIDVGTTFSGVSYAFMRPNEVPEIQTVVSFTDQDIGDSKVPSILIYDKDGTLKAAGAKAVAVNTIQNKDYCNWKKVKYFKMHLRPAGTHLISDELQCPLPTSMGVIQVMGDFLRYLKEETVNFIKNSDLVDGLKLWEEAKKRAIFVLCLPNGWTGLPQWCMRQAAIDGGLVENTDEGRSRVQFVTEGEASALACLHGGLPRPNTLQTGFRFVIADAGGGTLDMSSYEISSTSPLEMRELTTADSKFAGSLFVNGEARKILERKLRGSEYDRPDCPEYFDDIISDAFENKTKRAFKDATEDSWLCVGKRYDNNPELGILMGSMRLDGSELAECFDFSVKEALFSIRKQIAACGGKPMPVWLVGGFGKSPWLFKKLEESLGPDGVAVSQPVAVSQSVAACQPDVYLWKGVAYGAVLYSLEHTVVSRVARKTYGTVCNIQYSPLDPEHIRRKRLLIERLSGTLRIPNYFDIIVTKLTEVRETDHFDEEYFQEVELGQSTIINTNLYCHDGELPAPIWYDENRTSIQHVCTIRADLSKLCRPALLCSRKGKKYWKLTFVVELMFGLTELQARIKWKEDGNTI
ncbi:hypothetical protein DFH11DRAFT_1571301 [Phellopilus nigrolimitatus]|nr:hypothetical protein DFH11DRAFT_1571301 [Phellopilus nigrolimitatus]